MEEERGSQESADGAKTTAINLMLSLGCVASPRETNVGQGVFPQGSIPLAKRIGGEENNNPHPRVEWGLPAVAMPHAPHPAKESS
jgi:hypothetical protein